MYKAPPHTHTHTHTLLYIMKKGLEMHWLHLHLTMHTPREQT